MGVPLAVYPGVLVRESPAPQPPGHAGIALDEALNVALCGKPGMLSDQFDVALALSLRADGGTRAIRPAAAELAGSTARYCASVVRPFQNNENSLTWAMRVLLALDAGASSTRLGHELTWLRLSMLGVFLFALLAAGAGLAWSLALALFSTAILNHLAAFDLTAYPFLLVLPLASVALYVAADHYGWMTGGIVPVGLLAAAAGLLAGFTAHMRSTHAILCVAMFALFFVQVRARAEQKVPLARAGLLSLLLFVAGFLVFSRAAIAPFDPPSSASRENYSYHAVMHPIVLGLAVPESDLSRREGIRWSDPVGLTLARRANPNVTYLGPDYEPALRAYYLSLWRRYPAEMLALYRSKMAAAANGMFDTTSRLLVRYGLRQERVAALDAVVNGWMLLALLLVTLGWTFWRSRGPGASVFLGLLLVGTCGCLLLLECAAITTTFFPAYYSLLLLSAFIAVTAPLQMLVDALVPVSA
jgi:hypothetical protein